MKLALKTLQGLLVLSAVALGQTVHAQIVGYNVGFGAASGYSDNFLRFSDGALGTGLAWGATVGTNGGGGLTVSEASARNLFYRPTPASNATSTFNMTALNVGDVFSTSMDFKWADTTATGTTLITAGFVPSNGSQTALTSAGALAGSIIRNSGTNTVTLRMRNGNANATSLDFSQTTLTAGNWYRLSYDLTKSATVNTFTYTVSLFSIGTNGTSTAVLFNDGTNNITLSGSVTNSSIYGDTDAFFAYDIRGGATGISHVDNFLVGTPIPEPSSYALAVGGVALLMVARRRRGVGAKA